MAKLSAAEVPPPGVGVKTVTAAGPALARSEAAMLARSWVALTNVVARAPPFQRTTEAATKPLPFTVSEKPPLPAAALDGERLLADGVGADGAGGGGVDPTGRAGTERTLHDWSVLGLPAALAERRQMNPPEAAPLAWYAMRSWNGADVAALCWTPVPSVNAAT
jgi:hypothetical protein